ncbi:MAG: GPP34 family phosphoprotein [Alphaproteobacteria bacterium]|nr:GPP34 family phosphoprotein [Alphaproteobacteria bacterium]
MLSLPEALLLFALHDARGTVHSAAFLGLDEALSAAVLGELLLRGAIRVRSDGALRLVDDPPDTDSMLMLLAARALLEAEACTVDEALHALDTRLGAVRKRVVTALATKNILRAGEIDREGLADTETHAAADGSPEAGMLAHLREGIAAGPGVSRRIGLLIGLVHVLGLWSALLPEGEHAAACAAGDWVLERDAICRAARVAVQKAEGTWEG